MEIFNHKEEICNKKEYNKENFNIFEYKMEKQKFFDDLFEYKFKNYEIEKNIKEEPAYKLSFDHPVKNMDSEQRKNICIR
jgi:hypothetical protein